MNRTLATVKQLDLRVLRWLGKAPHPTMQLTARLISRTGDGYLQLLLPLLLASLAFSVGLPATGIGILKLFLIAFAVERCLYFLLKNTLKRKRPADAHPSLSSAIQASDQFSFPSGHTMAAFTLASLCIFVSASLAYPLLLWATAVGISRVVLGVHYPTDIAAGASLGWLIAWTCYTLYPISFVTP